MPSECEQRPPTLLRAVARLACQPQQHVPCPDAGASSPSQQRMPAAHASTCQEAKLMVAVCTSTMQAPKRWLGPS